MDPPPPYPGREGEGGGVCTWMEERHEPGPLGTVVDLEEEFRMFVSNTHIVDKNTDVLLNSLFYNKNVIGTQCCGSKYIEFGSGSGSRILAQFGSMVILSILKEKIKNNFR